MTKTIMNCSRIPTIIAAALVTALPATAHAASGLPGRGILPDDRGYELVSPPDKNGADVMADASRVRVSVSGDAVNFASLSAFGDAVGTGKSTDYLSQRTTQGGDSGWATHSLIPRVDPLSFSAVSAGQDTVYVGEFSDDLLRGVLRSFTPLTNDLNVSGVSNLYFRQGTASAPLGDFTLLSSCPGCAAPIASTGRYALQVAGSTPDLGHVVFEANQQLTPDAPAEPADCLTQGGCNPILYEWDHGVLRLAGVLPEGTAAATSMAGMGALQLFYTPGTISSDGRRIFFTVAPPGEFQGDLYMRLDHSSTVQMNASKRTDCADNGPCTGAPSPDPGGHQPAQFLTASQDGHKLFFTTSEQLTDTTGGDLYVYDTTMPVSDPRHLQHVYADQQPDDGSSPTLGVLGTSDDGTYIYFFNQSALVAGQSSLPGDALIGLYVAHAGAVKFIGSVDEPSSNADIQGKSWVANRLAARVTSDGRHLLFTSFTGAGLGGYDHGTRCGEFGEVPCAELYRYDAEDDQLTCVSCAPSGAAATSDAIFTVRNSTGGATPTTHLNHPMSSDGAHVVFETGERLLPERDVNGSKTDVYQWTKLGAGGCTSASDGFRVGSQGCLSLISTGNSVDHSHFLEASPMGGDVFFSTAQRLTGWDVDDNYDLYDARRSGGFPEPVAPSTTCAEDGCQGAPTPRPFDELGGNSATFVGHANVTAGRSGAAKPAKKPIAKARTKSERLRLALKSCKQRKRQRKQCEARARKRYGTAPTTTKKGR